MIKTASLENSKRLYELAPEWNDTHFGHYIIDGKRSTRPLVKVGDDFNGHQLIFEAIAPDLDWLIDKIPHPLKVKKSAKCFIANWRDRHAKGTNRPGQLDFIADTPADAACLLLIKLIEQGIVKVI